MTNPLVTTYGYDGNGNVLLRTGANGVIETRLFDALNRLYDAVAQGPHGLVYSASYGFDLVGNRLRVDEQASGLPARQVTYLYDSQYRLTGEAHGGTSTTYTYDPAGNRRTMDGSGGLTTYDYNERNELLGSTGPAGPVTYTRDLNGNRETRTAGGTTTLYTWDTQDRLVRASEGGSPVFAAKYDYRTRRVLKSETEETYYVHDGGLTLQEVRLPSERPLVTYIHGIDMGGGVGAMLYGERPRKFFGTTPGLVQNGGSTTARSAPSGGANPAAAKRYEFFCSNHVGHTVSLTKLNGAVKRGELFDAFGNSEGISGVSKETRRAYTKERDASISLDNHGFRYYDPATGRYVSRDPAGYVDGVNVYLHAGNNPANRYDPVGLSWRAALGLAGEYMAGLRDNIVGSVQLTYQAAKASEFNPSLASRLEARDELRQAGLAAAQDLAQTPARFSRGLDRILSGDATAYEVASAFARAAGEHTPVSVLGVYSKLKVRLHTRPPSGSAAPINASVNQRSLGTVGRSIEGPSPDLERYLGVVEDLDVSTPRNAAVFYSGPGNRRLAERFAEENGRMTLEKTVGGNWLDNQKLYSPGSPLTPNEATQVWSRLSERFASEASGNAIGFVRNARNEGIFNSIEYQTLLQNPNITNVITGGD